MNKHALRWTASVFVSAAFLVMVGLAATIFTPFRFLPGPRRMVTSDMILIGAYLFIALVSWIASIESEKQSEHAPEAIVPDPTQNTSAE